MMGAVYIIGAGCGDPGLITVKAQRILKQADCILYDRLIDPMILQYAPSVCKLIYVGKENHHHALSQQEIEQCLIECASKYTCVVRLKGGDPFVFGRGGEEVIALSNAGISFEVIPGIPSAIGGLAYAGIPVTHRGITNGFRVYTAHTQKDEITHFDYMELAKTKDTLIFLMGLSKGKEILQNLVDHGMALHTPAAICSNLSMPTQYTLYGTLDSLLQKDFKTLPSPAIIAVGDVVAFHSEFQVQKPLLGKRYLITSLSSKMEDTTWQLREQGAIVEQIQIGRIQTLPISITTLLHDDITHLLFVSRNAVKHFMTQLFQAGYDVRSLVHMQIGVMGEQTAKAIYAYGIQADIIPAIFDSTHLIETMKQMVHEESRIVICKGKNDNHELYESFITLCYVKEYSVYETIPCFIPDPKGHYDGIVTTCAFSVHQLLSQHVFPSPQVFYSIGAKTSKAIQIYGFTHILTLAKADKTAFVECILKEETSHV